MLKRLNGQFPSGISFPTTIKQGSDREQDEASMYSSQAPHGIYYHQALRHLQQTLCNHNGHIGIHGQHTSNQPWGHQV